MLTVFREYEENEMKVVEYTEDGENVTHVVLTPTNITLVEDLEIQPTIEEQTFLENQYQTALLEMNMLGVN